MMRFVTPDKDFLAGEAARASAKRNALLQVCAYPEIKPHAATPGTLLEAVIADETRAAKAPDKHAYDPQRKRQG